MIHPIQCLIEAAKRRTQRLIRIFAEFEREVWGPTSKTNCSTSGLRINATPYWHGPGDSGEEWWKYWKVTLKEARRVRAQKSGLTEEFREARRIGLERDPLSDPKDPLRNVRNDERNWAHYQLRRLLRHKWGQYLRSNMDWDWDLGACMKRLFKVEKHIRAGPPLNVPASSTAIDVGPGPEGTLKISMGDAQGGLPKEVQVAYKTKTGETQYMSFVPVGSGPGYHPTSDKSSSGPSDEQMLDSTAAQHVLEHMKGSFGGEREFENPDAFPSGFSQPNACYDIPAEKSNDGYEGKEPVYDAGYDEGRAGEDTISICSLD